MILTSGYYAAFRVTLVAKELEGLYDGAVHITTDFEVGRFLPGKPVDSRDVRSSGGFGPSHCTHLHTNQSGVFQSDKIQPCNRHSLPSPLMEGSAGVSPRSLGGRGGSSLHNDLLWEAVGALRGAPRSRVLLISQRLSAVHHRASEATDEFTLRQS